LPDVAADERVHIVMAAIVGAAGLSLLHDVPRLAGKRLLLANKEALVVGGEVFMQRCAKAAPSCCRSTANTPRFSSPCPDDAGDLAGQVSTS
jgi:hypothetical protein